MQEVALGENLLISLSVRSGFDLLWSVLDLERDSEVIFTGLTIPDMPKIVTEYGLRPIAVDLDLATMGPRIEELREKITPKTRAIVVAHLWGGLVDLSEIAEIARENDLLLIEDCAQAFVGTESWGDHRADVSMFSFGSIKTNTALGGAIFRVGDSNLYRRLQCTQGRRPIRPRSFYFRRLLKYAVLKVFSTRWAASALFFGFRRLGKSHDQFISQLAKGFAGPGFFRKIRQQPSTPLLKMLLRKLTRFVPGSLQKRTELGRRFANRLRESTPCIEGEHESFRPMVVGEQMVRPTYWVLAIVVDRPQELVDRLVNAGFDATQRSSMLAINPAKQGLDRISHCQLLQEQMVYLPLDSRMQASEIDRMVELVCSENPTFWKVDQGATESERIGRPSCAR